MVEISVGKLAREEQHARPDWRKADWKSMKAELCEQEWVGSVKRSSVDRAWRMVKEKVEQLIKKYIPNRRMRNKNRPNWMTGEILKAIRKKKRRWKRDKFRADKSEYKEQEKKTLNLIRNAKRSFEKKLSRGNSGNSRPFYAYIKQKTKCRPSIGPLKRNGATVTDDQEMANLLNRAFSDVFTREDTANIPQPDRMEMNSILSTVNISAVTVKKKIRLLRSCRVPWMPCLIGQIPGECLSMLRSARLCILATKTQNICSAWEVKLWGALRRRRTLV